MSTRATQPVSFTCRPRAINRARTRNHRSEISLKNKAPVSPKLVEGRGGREEETTHYITPIIKSIHVTSLEISFTRVPPLEQQRPAGAPSLCTTYIYTYIHTYIRIYIHVYIYIYIYTQIRSTRAKRSEEEGQSGLI